MATRVLQGLAAAVYLAVYFPVVVASVVAEQRGRAMSYIPTIMMIGSVALAPHPHVHAVVKRVSEQGVRPNIRKAPLREWRKEFARPCASRGSKPMPLNGRCAARRGRTSSLESTARDCVAHQYT